MAEKYPHEIVVEAATVAEALRSLETIDELKPDTGLPWPVQVDGIEHEIALYAETDMTEIHVRPRVGGAKKVGLSQILIGVVLIGVGIATGGIAALEISKGAMILSGAMMVVGGLLQMMLPTPQGTADQEESSKYLGASGNTVKIGTRIPLAYGNNKIGGHYLSFDVDAVDWAGEDEPEGVASVVGESVYVEYDKTPTDIVPVNPVFESPTSSPTNIPTAGWTA